jgi:hypothetical protein
MLNKNLKGTRDEAEQVFCDYMYNKGFIGKEDDVRVRRLDFGQNWSVMVNGKVFATCDYDALSNRFIGLKIIHTYKKIHNSSNYYKHHTLNNSKELYSDKVFTIGDYIKIKR